MGKPDIHLRNISAGREDHRLSWFEKANYARGLSKAAASYPDLREEHPFAAKGYGSWSAAFRRLGQAAAKPAVLDIAPFVVLEGCRAIGMATAEKLVPKPQPISGFENGGIELAYWHKQADAERALAIGRQVMSSLINATRSYAVPNMTWKEAVWMVTLPEDDIKEDICIDFGLRPINEPQPYDIDDGVTAPRQLWALPLFAALPKNT